IPDGEGGGELPVFTEYEEWQRAPQSGEGITCQACHMPDAARQAATGAPTRSHVSRHEIDAAPGLRRRALGLRVEVSGTGRQLAVSTTVENRGAGHHVPTGLPWHAVVLRVRAMGARGREQDHAERRFARVLVDGEGREAPFYAAARVASDNR